MKKTIKFSPSALVLSLGLLGASLPSLAQMPGPVPPEMIAAAKRNPVIAAGEQMIVSKDLILESLTLQAGGAVAAPSGQSLSMTVDGVEKTLLPGKYKGRIVLSVNARHPVSFTPITTHPFRQAIFVDANGIVASKSVLSAAGKPEFKAGILTGARIRSNGENFNGLLAAGGSTVVRGLDLEFIGNGGNDFAGYGAALMSDGKSTRLVVDGARVRTQGAVRTAVVAAGGSHLLVKNSDIEAKGGTLPSDYVTNVSPGEMKDAPWMLGIRGNNRATNVLGDGTVATYLNSRLAADGWGVLSIDASTNTHLTTINSRVELKGESGYGSYAIGNSTNRFFGTTIDVPTHGIIITDGHAVFGASTNAVLKALNSKLNWGMSDTELLSIPQQETVVKAGRHAVMSWGGATVKVTDATVLDTGEAVFLNKGATLTIDVDGSKGAQIKSRNGVIIQTMDNDDPGPVMTNGLMANTGVWREPTQPPAKIAGFDLTSEHATDTVAKFVKTTLVGDFFNGMRSRQIGGGFGPQGPSAEPPKTIGANLVLKLEDSQLTGVVTSSETRHLKDTITAQDYLWLGRVTNTPSPAINNGTILRLKKSRWIVTGPSYLNILDISEDSELRASEGKSVEMMVNGVSTPIKPGLYRGQIVVQPKS